MSLELFTDPLPDGVLYAILSHTWAEDEVTFRDMQDLSNARFKAGFCKLEASCLKTIEHGLQYVWVDTCCIDKSSSAELSEAINSMFHWYKEAVVCFALLSDFTVGAQSEALSKKFEECRWFTRGWCLQELIAPSNLLFYDREWTLVGEKKELKEEIETITGVDRWVLSGDSHISTIPLAKRMCWAARRQTSRTEDMAYCLLGIFDVNMPMIYGEGSKSFIRLQREILQSTTDLSLLAWQAEEGDEVCGVLAKSPAEFANCANIESSDDQFRFRDEITMTNKGLKICTSLQHASGDVYILDLHCYKIDNSGKELRIAIYLQRVLDNYLRSSPRELHQADPSPGRLPQSIYLGSNVDIERVKWMIEAARSQRIYLELPESTSRFQFDDICAVPNVF